MLLKPEQIKKFKEIHKDCEGFEEYSDAQIEEIANDVANYYLTLFTIQQRLKKESSIIKQ